MNDIKVGDKIYASSVADNNTATHIGTVVYVHPMKRFYAVEFSNPNGKYRESFLIRK